MREHANAARQDRLFGTGDAGPQGIAAMSVVRFRRERKSAVAVMFALLALPIVGLLGLAIDFGLWNQTSASLSLAASGAALNAVKVAAAGELGADPNYLTEGSSAGTQWFEAQAAHNAGNLVNVVPSVTVTGTTSITASVTYTGSIRSIFGNLFAVTQYPITVAASATISSAPYLNIDILLDNSSSMEIGATPNDIEAMDYQTTCSPEGEVTVSGSGLTAQSGQWFFSYDYDGYTGTLANPIPATELPPFVPPLQNGYLPSSGSKTGPACSNSNPTPYAGPPCAFACHWDSSRNAGLGQDYFGVARNTLGYSTKCYNETQDAPGKCAITLRFDLVKQAVNQVINTMQHDNLSINNLNVGVFTFPGSGGSGPLADVTPIYPGCTTPPYNTLACQGGNNWLTAIADVGLPPQSPNQAEPGIQPALWTDVWNATGDTDFPDTLNTLANSFLTASGDGTSPSTPVKVLFLVTDGVTDYTPAGGGRITQAIDPNDCQALKNLGYTIYVVYTPYYPLMNQYYLQNIKSFAEPMATGEIATNLQACSSDPKNDYIAADPNDYQSINNALQTFLQRALAQSAARFTL
jgi:Flp pilus assembly protein TadG